MPPRVAHVITPAAFGGLEHVVHSLATLQRSSPQAFDVSVVAFQEPDAPPSRLLSALDAAGVRTRALVLPGRAYRAQRRALIAVLRELDVQVAHSHGYHADVMLASCRRAVRCAAVTTLHGFTGGSRKNRLYEWLQLRAIRRFDAVVAVSAPIAERVRRAGLGDDQVHLIRNGWSASPRLVPRAEAQRQLGMPKGTYQIGWVGRLSAEKGADIMLDAFAQLGIPDSRLTVVGAGPEAQALRARAEELRISDRVRWAGAVADAGSLFMAFDVFALTSRSEGTPIALFEAMHAGIPIVATAVGGVPDVVSSREAQLVPVVDAAAVAAALGDVAANPAAAAERAERARGRLERDFAPGPWVNAYTRLYDTIRHR